MRSPIRVAAVLVLTLLSVQITAQQWQFGEPFPLTNTRYSETWGNPILLENDSGTFLFWATPEGVRVTKIIPGERRGGRIVLETVESSGFDVVWTGKHFFVAAGTSRGAQEGVVGQLLDENAENVGSARVLAEYGTLPRLASSKSAILLVFKTSAHVVADFMTLEGSATGVVHSFETSYSYSYSLKHDVASNGTNFAIAASLFRSMQTIVLDAFGAFAITSVDSGGRPEFITLESNGTDYVVAYGTSTTKMRRLHTNGDLDDALDLESSSGTPSIAWNGSEYVVAYVHVSPLGLSIARVDRDVRQVLSSEMNEEQNVGNPSVLVRGEQVRVAYGSPVKVTDLPFGQNEPTVVTYAAASQKLLGAASSNDATLVVWDEDDGLRFGLRTSDGRWRERVLPGLGRRSAVAASDGEGFVIFTEDPTSAYPPPVAIFIDSSGNPSPKRVELPCLPRDVVWTGSAWAIAGINRDGLVAAFLKPSGEVSAPVFISPLEGGSTELPQVSVATDGEGFLVVWEKFHANPFPPQLQFTSVSAFLLDGSLQKNSSEILVTTYETRWPAAAWRNGSYTIAFATEWIGGVYARALTNGTLQARSTIHTSPNELRDVRIATIGDNQWISWLETYDPDSAAPVHRIVSDSGWFTFRSGTLTAPFVVPMPAGGGVAYLGTTIQPPAPHHGRRHVMMAIADRVAPWRLNESPVMTARYENQVINLAWTDASSSADGYRVEYRIGDGSWNELNRWFDPDERSTAFFPIRSGILYSFRVRGWSEGGTGPYSAPAVVYTGRRRAVR